MTATTAEIDEAYGLLEELLRLRPDVKHFEAITAGTWCAMTLGPDFRKAAA